MIKAFTLLTAALTLVFANADEPRAPLPPFPEESLRLFRFDSSPEDGPVISVQEAWSGFAMDASSSSIELPPKGVDGASQWTVDTGAVRFWFKANTVNGSEAGILLQWGSPNSGFVAGSLDLNGSRDLLRLTVSGSNILNIPLPSADDWHHVTLNYGPSYEIYLNGVFAGSANAAIAPLFDNDAILTVGRGLAGGNPAHALIDEVATFSKQQTAAEAAAAFNRRLQLPLWGVYLRKNNLLPI